MSANGWVETLIASQIDGTALANSAAAASIIPPAARFTLPANFFSYIGKSIRIKAFGRISNIVTTPGTLTLDVRFGTVASPIVVLNGGAMQLNAVAKTNVTWWLECLLTARSIGNGVLATMMGAGEWTSESVVGSPLPSVGGSGTLNMPASAPAVGTGFDSTTTNVVDLFGTFSIANAGNSIQVHGYTLESLN
jgi:hypothetical protein